MSCPNENLEYLIRLAESAIYDGDYIQAEKYLISGLEDEPGYPKLHYTLGWMNNYHLENEKNAENHYLWTIFFDSDHDSAYKELGRLYLDKRKYQAVKRLMRKAKQSENADREFIFHMLGKVAEAEGNYKDAIQYYKSALMDCLNVNGTNILKQSIKRCRLKKFTVRFKGKPEPSE